MPFQPTAVPTETLRFAGTFLKLRDGPASCDFVRALQQQPLRWLNVLAGAQRLQKIHQVRSWSKLVAVRIIVSPLGLRAGTRALQRDHVGFEGSGEQALGLHTLRFGGLLPPQATLPPLHPSFN